jgi:hydrogenase nickel incorporation protein HypA/HybF
MHELSIVTAVIDEVSKLVAGAGGGQVVSITLRIGRLSCVQEGMLRFCFDLACADSELSGARLEIIDVPVRIWCPACGAERELPGVQSLACPECGRLSGDIRAGRELDLESIELEPLPTPLTEQTAADQTAIPPSSIEPDSIQP